ncbi:uncharacterized protein TNIN_411052 [Trichonephila inaurata madagascariensis]|uniref:Brain-specific angiogenesis inhibitor 1 n=1 Tax=Trichonephila inaurata madagascariensis TaxID=2747483 RepID=A0A8X6I6K9_9ARAC|nr:uncharacterized protein TNIN_411052 [Trichonephila inaurata madagascariensis]
MEASEVMPIAEGTELTLACMIQGSEDMKVKWFKDGYPVHVHTGERSMWTTIVPKNSQDQYTALLGFDRVASLDTGTFTCQVTDWGFVRNSSIYVHVLFAPQPQVSPMTATIQLGSSLVVTCLSRDDIYRDFGYTWLKNGRVLNPSTEAEMAEDLFPAGSRILLREAVASAAYSCIITSSAGSTRKDSIITVIDKERSTPCCPAEDYLKVRWTLTAANTENIQLCPTGYTGDVRRKCLPGPNGHGAVWEEPDFSDCFSGGFASLKKRVDSLRLGYLISDTSALLTRLKRYLMSKKLRLHFCEGEPIVDVLQDINSIKHGDKRNQDGWAIFLDITSALLESPILIKKSEKLIQLHNLIFSYGFQYAERSNDVNFELFERKVLAVQLGKIEDVQQSLRLPSKRYSSVSKFSDSPPLQYSWMTNSVEIDLSDIDPEEREDGNSTASVVVVFYKNLSSHLPQRFFTKKGIADVEYQLISSLVGVKMKGGGYEDNVSIRITLTSFNHTVTDKRMGWNISCGMADFKYGTVQFTTNHCHLIRNKGNNSICQCHRLGTYALLLTHYVLPEEKDVEVSFDAIAGSGCAICAFLLLITILMLLSVWRKIHGAITALKIQICVALLGAFGIFFCGLLKPLPEEFFSYTVSLIQFFLLTAFSLQLCLALAVYIKNVELKNVQYSFTKISALGWAIPVIIVGATLAAQSLEGYELEGWWLTLGSNFFYAYTSSILILTMFQVLLFLIVKTEIRNYGKVSDFLQNKKVQISNNRWWLTLGSNFFYAYTSSILILTMFQVLLFLIVKTEIRNYGKVSDFLQNKKVQISNNRISLLHRSLLLTSSLLFMSMASILYVNFEQKIYEILFAISAVTVGLVVFLSYTFCSEKHFLLCCLQENHDQVNEQEDSDIRSGTDSFKSFLKPEIVDDPYSRKMHIDAEKRTERIKRMYSQIEKASLSDSLTTHRTDATTELLGPHTYQQQPDSSIEDGHTPIFKPYQHALITNNSPRHMIKEGDAFCDTMDRGDGYPKMHWRYANHPHVMYGASGSNKHSREQVDPKRPLLLESDIDQPSVKVGEIQQMEFGNSQYPSSFASSKTFQPSKTVRADITCNTSRSESFSPLESLEDGSNLKNSCFMQHTDSLETVVHCETASEAPLKTITKDIPPPPTQSWNMTTV